MRSAICGRNIPVGHRDSYRRCLIAEDGTPNGRRRATAMKRSRHGSAGPHRCLPPKGSDAISRAASTWAGMLKVAIVGCGKIADAHASQIQLLKGCEIVGVYDREPLMAKQFYERFSVKRYFDDLTGLLSDARPDVVHVTTPPQSHFAIARFCLERGCHVYVEKPFTVDEGLLHIHMATTFQTKSGNREMALRRRRHVNNVRPSVAQESRQIVEIPFDREPLVELLCHQRLPVIDANDFAPLEELDLGRVSVSDLAASYDGDFKHAGPCRRSSGN